MKIIVTHPNTNSFVQNDEVAVPIQNLSSVDDATCLSIHLSDCMDYIPPQERYKLLGNAIKKLRHGGELTISGTDILAVAQQINSFMLSIDKANSILYQGRLSSDSVNNVLNNVQSMGLELINVKIDGVFYSIKTRRPDARKVE